MLKRTLSTALLAGLLLPTAYADDADKQSKQDGKKKAVVEETETTTEEVIETEVAVITVESDEKSEESKDGEEKKTTAVFKLNGQSDDASTLVWKSKDGASFKVIELQGDNVPKHLSLILEQVKKGEGAAKAKVMSFHVDGKGSAEGSAAEIHERIQNALKSAKGAADKVQGKEGEHVIRILQNVGPDAAKMQFFAVAGEDEEELKQKLADVKGTISISTSSSSSSSNGEEPTVVTNSQIRIISPDGKVQEFKLDGDNLNGASVSKAMQEALKRSGKSIPEDMEAKVREAMKRAEERSKAIWVREIPRTRQAVAEKTSSVEKKLDLILKRLEQLEQEIETLKKND